MGCANIQLRNNRVGEYPPMRLSTSNKRWHSHWFYLKNNAISLLPVFIGHLVKEVPDSWRKWGLLEKDKKKIRDHLIAIWILKERA